MLNIIILNIPHQLKKAINSLNQCKHIRDKDSFVNSIKIWHATPLENCKGLYFNVKRKYGKNNETEHQKLCEESNTRSIIDILKYAKQQDWEYFLLLEDDFELREDNEKCLKTYIESLPENFGICYIGGYLVNNVYKGLKKYNDCWLKMTELNHCYYDIYGNCGSIINKSIYDDLINELEKFDYPISDYVIKRVIHKKTVPSYIANPIIVFQNTDIDSMHKVNWKLYENRHFDNVNISLFENSDCFQNFLFRSQGLMYFFNKSS